MEDSRSANRLRLGIGGLLIALSALLGSLVAFLGASPERIVFLSVGQGDCTLIQSQGRTVLIDVGPRSPEFDAGQKLIVPKLARLGVQSVDLILLSHPDMDHVGGLGAVVGAYPGATVAAPATFQRDEKMLSVLRSATVQNPRWIGNSEGRFGDLRLVIRTPPWREGTDDNGGSMFVHLTNDYWSETTSGDAPAASERLEEPQADWRAALLHVGHHGSKTSTEVGWLQAVHPATAIISCGRNNPYGHPHKEILSELAEENIHVLRTDQDGDIEFDVIDGRLWEITPQRVVVARAGP